MLNVFWFSTSTLPLRSNSTPRGAGSGSRRRWLFSAISSNFWCWATWKTQNATASAAKTTATTTCSTDSRRLRLRRSSGGSELLLDCSYLIPERRVGLRCLILPSAKCSAARAPALQQSGAALDELERQDPDQRR